MIILGLGTNVGDRLANLRQTLKAIKKIPQLFVKQVSPVYISDALLPANAPADWDMPYLNLALRCETTLTPEALHQTLKTIEADINQHIKKEHWGPRIIDIDLLAWDGTVIEQEQLHVPRANMLERPFALWPLADVAPTWVYPLAGPTQGKTAAQLVEPWGSRFSGRAPFRTRQIQQRIDTPQLMGIVNVTPDSFSDGGLFLNTEKAIQQALQLVASGADIIDIGAESTAPNAKPVDSATEWARLEPVLAAIKAETGFLIPPKISIDTRHADVAEKALAMGIDWLNDVSGLDDPAMRDLLLQSQKDCVMMHHLQLPVVKGDVLPRDQNVVELVYTWGEARLNELEQQGIAREKIIFDPGVGFGKGPEHSLMLVKHAQQFSQLGTRLLIGHSRKSFLSTFTASPFAERDIETLAIMLYLAQQPVDYIRVHNIDMCARALKVMAAL